MVKIAQDGPFTLFATDKPDQNDGAHHKYEVSTTEDGPLCAFNFQHGPLQEVGPNGAPDLLIAEALHHRASHYAQRFGGEHNHAATDGLKIYIDACNARTADRKKRSVEGTRDA